MAALTHLPEVAGARPRHWLMAGAGAFGLALALTGLWLTSRAVLAVGGACAEGGPYVVETGCPDGVVAWGAPAVPAMFAFGALLAYGASRIQAGAAFVVLAGWPVLFLSLGFNFLDSALAGGAGVAGWVVCGVIFVLMGAPGLYVLKPVVETARLRPALVAVLGLSAAAGTMLALAYGPAA